MSSPQNTAEPGRSIAGVTQSLARSFAVYSGANFVIRALNFLLVLVYAHYLRPSDYGIIYLSDTIAWFLIIFVGLSIDSGLQRLYFQHNHDAMELRSYLGSTFRFGLGTMFILLACVLGAGKLIPAHLASVPFYPYIAISITTAVAVQGIQYLQALYQTERKPLSYALFTAALTGLTALCCVYGVILRHGGALGMLYGKLAAAVLVFAVALWEMRVYLTAPFRWRFVRASLAFSLPLVPHMVMASGLVVADRFILEHYRGLHEVGIYSLAYTLGMVMYLVTQSLGQAWQPMFFQMASDDANRDTLGRICSGLCILLASLACVGILLSPWFVHVALDERYRAAAQIVPLIILGYFFHALFSVFDLSILQAKRTGSVFLVSFIAFAFNIALNFAFVVRWGMLGAAWATTLAYMVEAIGSGLLAQRFFSLPYRWGKIAGAVLVVSGTLVLALFPWSFEKHAAWLAAAVLPALGLLTLVGGEDLRKTLSSVRTARRRGKPVE